MAKKVELTQEIVRELLDYDPETGLLFWKDRDIKWFNAKEKDLIRIVNAWNVKNSGKIALRCLNKNGYFHGPILGKYYLAHRVIWLWVNGEFPTKQLDHLDGNSKNNKISNLKEATNSENHKNMPLSSKNTSGHLGVSFNSRVRKWVSVIKLQGKVFSLGYFENKNDAINARKVAEKKFGFSTNHGRVKID